MGVMMVRPILSKTLQRSRLTAQALQPASLIHMQQFDEVDANVTPKEQYGTEESGSFIS